MKKILLKIGFVLHPKGIPIPLIIGIIVMLSFATPENEKKDMAQVDQVQGVFVFIRSKPVASYDYLGTVKINFSWNGHAKEMVNIAIKKCKKDFPNTDAIIFTTDDLDVIDAIKFK